jgi:hypothetical protein
MAPPTALGSEDKKPIVMGPISNGSMTQPRTASQNVLARLKSETGISNQLKAWVEVVMCFSKVKEEALASASKCVLHAAQKVPALDIYVSTPDTVPPAQPTVAGMKFTPFAPSRDQGSLQVAKGAYQIRVAEAGKREVVFDSGKVSLPGGQDV